MRLGRPILPFCPLRARVCVALFLLAAVALPPACIAPPPGGPANSNGAPDNSAQPIPDAPTANANENSNDAPNGPLAPRLRANAGEDQAIVSGAIVSLSGGNSILPADGATVLATWSQLSGPTVVMQTVASLNAAFLIEQPGIYEFVLTLTVDAEVSSDSVVVTVAELPGRGTLSGRVSVAQLNGATISEIEPNSAIDQAQDLGSIVAGQRITVVGHAAESTGDEYDAFLIRTPRMVRIDAAIEFEIGAANADLDLLLYDRLSGQFVGRFDGTTAPERASFFLSGGCDLVLRSFRGDADYHLTIIAADVDGAAEREPNDVVGSQQYVGSLTPGEQITIRGEAAAGSDRDERLLFSAAAAAQVTAWLSFPAAADFDLIIADASEGSATPQPMTRFDTTQAEFERGTFTVAPFSLTEIDVRAFAGAGPWELTLIADSAPTLAFLPAPPAATETEKLVWKSDKPAPSYGTPATPFVPGELILNGDEASNMLALAELGMQQLERIPDGPIRAASPLPGDWTEGDRRRRTLAWSECAARSAPGAKAEPNWIRAISREPNDTFYPRQWHYPLLNLPAAWDLSTGSSNVIVAVVDTGITAHPDLAGRVIAGFDFVSDSRAGRDGDGRDPDPSDPGDLYFGTASSFHGTHVAGTVCTASNNGSGVAGTAWDVRIMPLRALGRGGGTSFDIVNAVLYAAGLANASGQLPAQRADIINLSLGGSGSSQAEQNAFDQVRAAGVLVVAASGNENSSASSFPAAYRNVLSIGAVDLNRNRAPYSNFGPTLDLMAPGGNTSVDLNRDGFVDGVLSTWADDSGGSIQFVYGFLQGTSMAAPHAAGVAALLLSADPTLTPDEIEIILRQTATDLGPAGRDNFHGDGLINARAALERALGLDGGNGNTNTNTNENGSVNANGNANANSNQNTNTNSGAEPTPILGLSRGSLNFGAAVNTDSVTVSNLGDGRLRLTGLVARTNDLFNWLSAQAEPSTDASRDFARVTISVNRSGLPIGDYTGTVEVRTNGGTLFVQVSMSVAPAIAPTPPDVNLTVRLVDTRTDEVVRSVVVNPRGSDRYNFADVPAGSYYIVAGSDLDADGALCEALDYCGAYPTRGLPTPIRIVGDITLDTLDFSVAINSFEPANP